MSLTPGARIGPYEIGAPIGAGGMGEVYRARDTRLDRDVAIKILPDAFARDPERLARFEREAKTLASLNHPNIAQVHGIETPAGSSPALVMEFVDGEDLSLRLARGAVPWKDTLAIAGLIAEALEAAHERGIIHRDLKPANIKVSADGAVKVLDFGLAKAIEGSDSAIDARNSPTISIASTRAGLILGTAGYMAPEQARGQTVDRRADIWAFGVIVFEMLCGKQAFEGDTISDVLASVLKNDIDWRVLPPDLPAPVLSLLRRCLNPDRRNRLRDIGEARIAIDDLLARPDGGGRPPMSAGRGRVQTGALAGTSVALVLALAALGVRGGGGEAPSMRLSVAPPPGVSPIAPIRPSISIAADGWTMAFVGMAEGMPALYLRGRDDFEARKLPGTEGASNPVFSPDGRRLAFVAGTDLKLTSLDGTVTVVAGVNDPRGIAWVDDETLVYTPEAVGGMRELPLNGGAARALSTLDENSGERTHRWPHVLPGGEWVLFTVGSVATPDTYDEARIDAVNRRTGERRAVFEGASIARYAPTGHLVFAKGGALFAVAFDPATLKTSGTPSGILQGVAGDLTTGAAHFDWSAAGTFAYVPGDTRGGLRQFAWSDLKGARQRIDLAPSLYNDVRLSPDGKRIAVAAGTTGLADIWVHTLDRGMATRLTFTAVNGTPIWSHDGRDIFYSAIDPARGTTVFRASADGGRDPVEMLRVDARVYLKNLAPDGSWALVDFVRNARASVGRIALKAGAALQPVVDTPADEFAAALSPDGRFVAYQSDGDGLPQIYVRDVHAPVGRWQVSNAGGEEPMWSPSGDAIYYRFESRMMRAPVLTRGTFQSGQPALLFDGVFNLRSDTAVSYQPHPDGRRLLMTRPAEIAAGGTVRFITRWFDELARIK